jgi:hypothetical protein
LGGFSIGPPLPKQGTQSHRKFDGLRTKTSTDNITQNEEKSNINLKNFYIFFDIIEKKEIGVVLNMKVINRKTLDKQGI